MDKPNNIKILRTQKNLSQGQLAEKLHVHQTAVSSWETGNSYPDMQTAIELSKYFNVSIDYLIGISDGRAIGYSAHNVRDSNFVQGSGSVTVNGGEQTMSAETLELIRVFEELDVKSRHKLMGLAFELEEESERGK